MDPQASFGPGVVADGPSFHPPFGQCGYRHLVAIPAPERFGRMPADASRSSGVAMSNTFGFQNEQKGRPCSGVMKAVSPAIPAPKLRARFQLLPSGIGRRPG